MKKLNALIIASMTGLALAGGFFFAGTASAADYDVSTVGISAGS